MRVKRAKGRKVYSYNGDLKGFIELAEETLKEQESGDNA